MAKTKISISPSDVSSNWAGGMKGSVQKIVKGVQAVQENPADKAIAALDLAKQNYIAAIDSGKTAAALGEVNINDWKNKTVSKVQSRLSGGVDEAMPKRQKFDQYLVQTMNQILPDVAAKKKMTIDDGIEKVRMIAMHMHNNPYKK